MLPKHLENNFSGGEKLISHLLKYLAIMGQRILLSIIFVPLVAEVIFPDLTILKTLATSACDHMIAITRLTFLAAQFCFTYQQGRFVPDYW